MTTCALPAPIDLVSRKRQRCYSDEEISNALAALAANNGNLYGTAKQLGIPKSTLEKWSRPGGLRRMHDNPICSAMVTDKKEDLAAMCERIAFQAGEVVASKLGESSAAAAATIQGINIDKMLVLRGETPEQVLKVELTVVPDWRAV